MNYFFVANLVLLLGSIYTIRSLAIRSSRDRPILALVLPFERHRREEYLFFPDFSYTMGAIYTVLCGLLFFSNCIAIWCNWGLLTAPNPLMIGRFLYDQQILHYLLSLIGMVIALFILPDRTMKLKDAQPAFVSFSLTWLSIALLGNFLCRS